MSREQRNDSPSSVSFHRYPTATYRIQFHAGFGFEDARRQIPYLSRLGVTHLYASPLLRSRAGSSHGYDVVDPSMLDPKLGTTKEFDALVFALHSHALGLILDIVPNHMAASDENPWWWDVLEKGPSSPHARHFDIDWASGGGAIVLPVLGRPRTEVIDRGEIRVALEPSGLMVRYYDTRFPLRLESYRPILDEVGVVGANGAWNPVTAREDLWQRYESSPDFRRRLDRALRRYDDAENRREGGERMRSLLEAQHYRLCYWREAISRINYRRFFDINDLVAIRVERPATFQATHRLIVKLVRDHKVQGLRVDHIDGLFDPAGYLERVRDVLSADPSDSPFVVVEKILAENETLPDDWRARGTTGYELMNWIDGALVDPSGLRTLTAFYRRQVSDRRPWSEIVYQCKRSVLEQLFQSDCQRLVTMLTKIASSEPVTPEALAGPLLEVTACLPVYRTYVRSAFVSPRDRKLLRVALHEARRRRPELDRRALGFLGRVLRLEVHDRVDACVDFVMHWQQLTGPAMAKGFEDTGLYRYHPLLSLNEVGGDPSGSFVSVAGFHRICQERRRRWPRSMNATSTHDTKRSEDVRARLHVLSELPEIWSSAVRRWDRWNGDKRQLVGGRRVPDARDRLLIYQTLVGAWPYRKSELPRFRQRVKDFLIKAAREAKQHTSWLNPDPDYEKALGAFAGVLMSPSRSPRFFPDVQRFVTRIEPAGAINSLSQSLLKTAAPGAPDYYQGTELWALSLVDPDNRRSVDFDQRSRLLRKIDRDAERDLAGLVSRLVADWRDGRIKLFLISRALRFRARFPELFATGHYIPLVVRGRRAESVLAFARRLERQWAVAVVPRCVASWNRRRIPLGPSAWKGTHVVLPRRAPKLWQHVHTHERIAAVSRRSALAIPLESLFGTFPVALITNQVRGAPGVGE